MDPICVWMFTVPMQQQGTNNLKYSLVQPIHLF